MDTITLEKFEDATEIVKNVILKTNLIYSDYLSEQTGNKIYLKPENDVCLNLICFFIIKSAH